MLMQWNYTRTVNSGETPYIDCTSDANGNSNRLMTTAAAASGTRYATSIGPSAYVWNYVSTASNWSALHSFKQVLTPDTTGFRGASTAGGATYNWAAVSGITGAEASYTVTITKD